MVDARVPELVQRDMEHIFPFTVEKMGQFGDFHVFLWMKKKHSTDF
jgi:hypothetical protein